MYVFSFSWDDLSSAPHLPSRRFICIASHLPAALALLNEKTARPVDRFYEVDASGEITKTTHEGANHNFEWEAIPIEEGAEIYSNI